MTRVSAGVVALLVAASAAHAQPTAVAVSRIAKFVRATCDWLGRDPEIRERQLAEHIGRITKMEQTLPYQGGGK